MAMQAASRIGGDPPLFNEGIARWGSRAVKQKRKGKEKESGN